MDGLFHEHSYINKLTINVIPWDLQSAFTNVDAQLFFKRHLIWRLEESISSEFPIWFAFVPLKREACRSTVQLI